MECTGVTTTRKIANVTVKARKDTFNLSPYQNLMLTQRQQVQQMNWLLNIHCTFHGGEVELKEQRGRKH